MGSIKAKYGTDYLIEILKSGDQKQFGIVYDYFSRSLFGVIKQIVKDNEDLAQDLLQETFVKIWNNSSSYNEEKSRLFTWMLNIARNTAIDHIRSKQGKNEMKNHSLDNFVSIANHDAGNHIAHEYIGVKKLINELKPEYKVLIDLAYFEGYTQAEIAKKLNIPLGTVKTRLRAALQLLQKLLKL